MPGIVFFPERNSQFFLIRKKTILPLALTVGKITILDKSHTRLDDFHLSLSHITSTIVWYYTKRRCLQH
jgi:hypothetical protein